MTEKITVFAMGLKGFASLKQLVEKYGASIFDKVIYATDKGVIRDYSSDIIKLCQSASIPVYYRTEHFTIETPYSIAIAWRWLIHAGDGKEIIVFHDSLLPKHRGFAPLVSALIRGDHEIGVTALFATMEFDRGEIIMQKKSPIIYPIKVKEAIDILSVLYGDLTIDVFDLITSRKPIISQKQNELDATYSLWRNDDDYAIDWKQEATTIARFIDSVGYPYLGASSTIDGVKVRILDSEPLSDITVEDRERQCGKVLFTENQLPVLVCGKGLLRIREAVRDFDRVSILPLKKFRIKFA